MLAAQNLSTAGSDPVAGERLWKRFASVAHVTGALFLKAVALDLWRKSAFRKATPLTKQFLAQFGKALGDRHPEAVWAAFLQQDWPKSTLEAVAAGLKDRLSFESLAPNVRANFSRAGTLLMSTEDKAADQEIRFVRHTLAVVRAGKGTEGEIAKAMDLAKIHGMQAAYRELSKHTKSSALPIILGIGGALAITALLIRKG